MDNSTKYFAFTPKTLEKSLDFGYIYKAAQIRPSPHAFSLRSSNCVTRNVTPRNYYHLTLFLHLSTGVNHSVHLVDTPV